MVISFMNLNILRVWPFLERLAGHVARMGDRRGVYRFLVRKPEGKNHLGDPGVDGRILLRWIFKE
jgi:hypothetical protein